VAGSLLTSSRCMGRMRVLSAIGREDTRTAPLVDSPWSSLSRGVAGSTAEQAAQEPATAYRVFYVIVSGIAGTGALLIFRASNGHGFSAHRNKTGRSDRVIVTHVGSDSESTSTIARESAQVIMNAPGVSDHGRFFSRNFCRRSTAFFCAPAVRR
jgi:hypothetical protein